MTVNRLARRLRPLVLSAGLVVAAFALWHPVASLGFEATSERPAPLGLIGLSEGETVRVSVADAVGIDSESETPGRCALKVGFVDADGVAIGDAEFFRLASGAARSIELSAERAGVGDPSYARPVVVDLRPDAGCRAVVTTEVLDRDGTGRVLSFTPLQPPIPVLAPKGETS